MSHTKPVIFDVSEYIKHEDRREECGHTSRHGYSGRGSGAFDCREGRPV